jgi:hypothetical protein
MNAPAQNLYTIEKGIKLPSFAMNVYGFETMEVGDSFALKTADDHERARVRSAASYFGTRHGKKFAIRIADPVTGKRRCWRIK